jgi:hypothetical protein
LAFPRRDRAYLIGPHGMIFRYRIVSTNYTAANALDAPLMPAFGAMELSAKADTIRRDISALQSKLGIISGGAPSTANASSGQQAANASGGFTQQAVPQRLRLSLLLPVKRGLLFRTPRRRLMRSPPAARRIWNNFRPTHSDLLLRCRR